jgi:hypothetical protein
MLTVSDEEKAKKYKEKSKYQAKRKCNATKYLHGH